MTATAVLAVAVLVGALSPAVRAQTFEQDYLAARARLLERLEALPNRCLDPVKPEPDVLALASDLEARLQRHLGSSVSPIVAVPGGATPSWRCLYLGDPHFFDALSYATKDGRGSVTVTTSGLLRAWAERRVPGQEALSGPPGHWADGLPRDGEWYTWGIMGDATGLIGPELPVRPTRPGVQALAYLVGASQGFYAWQPPGNLLVIVAGTDRVSVAFVQVVAFPDGAACQARLEPFDNSSLDRTAARDREARAAYAACWSAAFATAPTRAALTADAQALVEALEGP